MTLIGIICWFILCAMFCVIGIFLGFVMGENHAYTDTIEKIRQLNEEMGKQDENKSLQ